jgi:hypothetical protein
MSSPGLKKSQPRWVEINHQADWERFRLLVNTSKMAAIANRRRWTPLLIEAATDRWYSGVNIAFDQV